MGFNLEFKGLNPICHLLALLGVHHFLHISRIRVKGTRHNVGFAINEVLEVYMMIEWSEMLIKVLL
jgi:hypothetical protein